MVITNNTHYFIEPLKGHDLLPGEPHPHVLYKAAHVSTPQFSQSTSTKSEDNSYCSEHG